MDLETIKRITNGWDKEKRMKFAGLCGKLSRGRKLEEAMKQAFEEMADEKEKK